MLSAVYAHVFFLYVAVYASVSSFCVCPTLHHFNTQKMSGEDVVRQAAYAVHVHVVLLLRFLLCVPEPIYIICVCTHTNIHINMYILEI